MLSQTTANLVGLSKQLKSSQTQPSPKANPWSQASEPYRLADLGFKTTNFDSFLYATELPPGEMYKLLTEEWQMGHHLAEAMVMHFGGHIHITKKAVMELSEPGRFLFFKGRKNIFLLLYTPYPFLKKPIRAHSNSSCKSLN